MEYLFFFIKEVCLNYEFKGAFKIYSFLMVLTCFPCLLWANIAKDARREEIDGERVDYREDWTFYLAELLMLFFIVVLFIKWKSVVKLLTSFVGGCFLLSMAALFVIEHAVRAIGGVRSSQGTLSTYTRTAIVSSAGIFTILNPVSILEHIVSINNKMLGDGAYDIVITVLPLLILGLANFFIISCLFFDIRGVTKLIGRKMKSIKMDNLFNRIDIWLNNFCSLKKNSKCPKGILKAISFYLYKSFFCLRIVLKLVFVILYAFAILPLIILISYLYNGLCAFVHAVNSISEKVLIITSFRSSFIISTIMLEVLLRIGYVQYRLPGSIDIFEFIVSAVLIPFIILWIGKIKNIHIEHS